MELNKLLSTLYYIGMVMLLIGIVLHIAESSAGFYLYATGLLPVFGVRVYNLIIGRPESKRKHGIFVISAIMLVLAGVAMFTGRSYWVLFLAISAVLDFYISFRRF
ncbi:hypothetical protein [Alkalitalea saponilacus]|uniref:Uncharacterized protein n=1 Tax=Alkalitalea saponilacus TaxID=889453 RepID=A0A1T5BPM8_9BACT|nr:hypothetical protein [Alkalitalea saponilacus]ASB49631.1 hypothetical protein CDL62_11010 [Alkalitalea saponilacus]SKB49262.1 hypothetical protein SAMN03080601_00584 [Alkalitalea saponilacus]